MLNNGSCIYFIITIYYGQYIFLLKNATILLFHFFQGYFSKKKAHIVFVDKCVLFGGDSGARTYDLTDVNRAL